MYDENLQSGSFNESPIGIAIKSQNRLLENIIANEIMEENFGRTSKAKQARLDQVFLKEKERVGSELESWHQEKERELAMQRERRVERHEIYSQAREKRRRKYELDLEYMGIKRKDDHEHQVYRNRAEIERMLDRGYFKGMQGGYDDMRRPPFWMV